MKKVLIMPTDNHPPPSSILVSPQAGEKTVSTDREFFVIREMLDCKKGMFD